METRVMISAADAPATRVRVDADLGYGLRALPPFEIERRVDAALEVARERVLREVIGYTPTR